jgi:cobalamin transport system substrate-binding protein
LNRALPALFLLLFAAVAASSPLTFQDDRGAQITLAARPQRIVSLVPSLTESVCAIGACSLLVGTDRYSDWPESVKLLPKLGGLEDTQIESVVLLRPDVVLASTSARVIDRLEGLGLHVVVLRSDDRADVLRTLSLLGKMLDRSSAAETVWGDIERRTRDAAERVPRALRGRRVYFEVDSTPYAAGAGSYIGQILAQLGMNNAVPEKLGPFPKLNPEYVVRMEPDIIMAPRQELAEMPGRPGWSSLRALREQQTCGFDSARDELLVRPGPRMGEAAELLAECLAGIARRP